MVKFFSNTPPIAFKNSEAVTMKKGKATLFGNFYRPPRPPLTGNLGAPLPMHKGPHQMSSRKAVPVQPLRLSSVAVYLYIKITRASMPVHWWQLIRYFLELLIPGTCHPLPAWLALAGSAVIISMTSQWSVLIGRFRLRLPKNQSVSQIVLELKIDVGRRK